MFNIRGMRRCDENYHEMIGYNNEGMTGEASIIIYVSDCIPPWLGSS